MRGLWRAVQACGVVALLAVAGVACEQRNPVFIGIWMCGDMELQFSGDGRFRWRSVDGDELNGNFHLVRDGSAYRIDYQPVRWAVQEKRYIPSRYPVDGFYLSDTPSGEAADMLACQRKRVRGAARVLSWLDEGP